MHLIVLDRDGVINADSSDYIRSAAQWQPLPGSLEAIATLSRQGISIAVATNQSGLARGYFRPDDLAAMHCKMRDAVVALGGRITAVAWCPHHPDDGCSCRKPLPGLVQHLERALDLSASGQPLVGDSLSDMKAAKAAGCIPVLVRTGKGAGNEAAARAAGVEWVFDDLAAFGQAVMAGDFVGDFVGDFPGGNPASDPDGHRA